MITAGALSYACRVGLVKQVNINQRFSALIYVSGVFRES